MDKVTIHACDGAAMWPYFARHHYMSDAYHGHGAVVATMSGELVGFASYIAFPSGTIPQPAKREHRTVILPDFQGMGIGVRLSDTLAAIMLGRGCRYFSKTSHPRMGDYRDASPLWKPTHKNGLARTAEGDHRTLTRWQVKRTKSYSHEFIGDDPTAYERVLAAVKTDIQERLW